MSTTAGPGARTRATSWDEVETANGGAGNDTLLAYDDGGFSLLGGAGDDVLSGSQGDDRVERVGDDRLEAGDVVGAILIGGSATTSWWAAAPGGRPGSDLLDVSADDLPDAPGAAITRRAQG